MISILMATYNGEKYLQEQFESLADQTIQSFHLYIRDDASNDQTKIILQDWKQRLGECVSVEIAETNSGNSKHNFLQMMCSVRDDYIMLCDQDDVWVPNKTELLLAKMHELEYKHGKKTPVLVYSDLVVVDENLNVIHPSFWKTMKVGYWKTDFRHELAQNTMTGCTCMYNRALAELIREEPEYCIMHDWWLELVASAFGVLGHVKSQTVLYRQHGKNVFGAQDMSSVHGIFKRITQQRRNRQALHNTYSQANSFINVYGKMLEKNKFDLGSSYSSFASMQKIVRIWTLIKLGSWKHGIIRKIAQILYI